MNPAMKILVVDDSTAMRKIVFNNLFQLGFTNMIEASDGAAALEIVKKEKIDLIISDLNMPNMNGIELLRAVRSSPMSKTIPFLMATAEGLKHQVSEVVELGVNGFVTKPYNIETFTQALETLFHTNGEETLVGNRHGDPDSLDSDEAIEKQEQKEKKTHQYVTFRLDDTLVGIDIHQVREINKVLDITPVQHAPVYIRGLINLRGKTVTVFDLGVRIGLAPREITSESQNIILKKDAVGLLVDTIGDVVECEDNEIHPPPANIGGIESDFIIGIIRLPCDLLIILSADKILEYKPK